MTKVAKKSADLFCKLKLIYDFIRPQFGDKPDLVEIESVSLLCLDYILSLFLTPLFLSLSASLSLSLCLSLSCGLLGSTEYEESCSIPEKGRDVDERLQLQPGFVILSLSHGFRSISW
jgi:hypothetical protein